VKLHETGISNALKQLGER